MAGHRLKARPTGAFRLAALREFHLSACRIERGWQECCHKRLRKWRVSPLELRARTSALYSTIAGSPASVSRFGTIGCLVLGASLRAICGRPAQRRDFDGSFDSSVGLLSWADDASVPHIPTGTPLAADRCVLLHRVGPATFCFSQIDDW